MRILNFGSLNLDMVYQVPHFVQPGETLSSLSMATYCGGKGLNQSIALARAGFPVLHAGMVGTDGQPLLDLMKESGVDTSFTKVWAEGVTGHAIIQVDEKGQNCIILYAGANGQIGEEQICDTLAQLDEGDWLLLQNEISNLPIIFREAKKRGLKIALNPSPYNEGINALPLEQVSLFLLNEIEGASIAGGEANPDAIKAAMREKYPNAAVVLTLGSKGARYFDDKEDFLVPIIDIPVVDTTAAGDTFTGYFLAAILQGKPAKVAMEEATMASTLAVSRKGAAPSIPYYKELDVFKK